MIGGGGEPRGRLCCSPEGRGEVGDTGVGESEKRSRNSIVASGCSVEEEWQGNNGAYLTLVTGLELEEGTTKDTDKMLNNFAYLVSDDGVGATAVGGGGGEGGGLGWFGLGSSQLVRTRGM